MAPHHVGAFEALYGPDGEWVRLFRCAAGYRSTELLRDRFEVGRFVTVDCWDSEEAWRTFRIRYAEAFEALDARCEALTLEEREWGRFAPVE